MLPMVDHYVEGAGAPHNHPMPRPSQLLHPQREPAPTRPAATVLLLRDSAAGIEVLMTRRSMTASFAPGAYVFPGGGIDVLDAGSHAQATRRPTQSDAHLTQAIPVHPLLAGGKGTGPGGGNTGSCYPAGTGAVQK